MENKVSWVMPERIKEDRSASAFPYVYIQVDSHHFSIFVLEKSFSLLSFCLKCSYIHYREEDAKRQMATFASKSALIKHLYSRGKGCTAQPRQQLLCYCRVAAALPLLFSSLPDHPKGEYEFTAECGWGLKDLPWQDKATPGSYLPTQTII